MSETYNKNWVSEIKSVDVKSDGKHNEKQDKVRLAAISLLDDFKTRSLPPEQFNRLVEEVKDILRRKDIDKWKLESEYWNILGQEKVITEFNTKIVASELTLRNINKTVQKKWIIDNVKDKIPLWEVSETSKENIKNIKSYLSKNYQELKDFYLVNGNKLTEKQKLEYEKLLSKCRFLLDFEIKDASVMKMLENQASNIWKQISETFKIPEAKANSNPESFKKIINSLDYKWIENIYKDWKQKEFEEFLLKNWAERRFFIKWIKEIKGGMCPIDNQNFYNFLWKIQLVELNQKRKEFEKKLVVRLWEKYWKLLIEYIDKQLKEDPCSFSLIKVISDFNNKLDWKNVPKLSLEEIKNYAQEWTRNENENIKFELTNFLWKNNIDLNEFDWKSEKQINDIMKSKWINVLEQKRILDMYSKYKGGDIAAKRLSYFSSYDIGKIIDWKTKWKSNNDINSELEKWNPALKAFNQSNNISSNYNFSSSVIHIPSDNRREFYSELYKNLDSWKDWDVKTLSSNDWFNFNISKTWNKYRVNYWDRTEICERNEVRNVVEMWRYMNKIWLGFLFWGISRIIQKINSKPTWIKINELDWLDNSEKILWLKSIWEALIPWFDSTKTDIKDLEKQFTDKVIFNEKINKAKADKSSKFYDKLKGQIWNISSLEQLAKVLYSGDSKRKDFPIDSFIKNI